MRRFLRFLLVFTLSVAAGGCASKKVPQLTLPLRVDAFCDRKEPRLTALLSIMSTTGDAIVREDRLTDASVRAAVRKDGGVVGYWNEQLLYLPKTARALGESGDYARVREAAVTVAPDGATSRPLYLKVRERWIVLNAFDVQNPCVEGHRAM